MEEFNNACSSLHKKSKSVLERLPDEIKKTVTDIVMRKNNALYVVCRNTIYFVSVDGSCSSDKRSAYIVSSDEVNESILRACKYSMYAHKEELLKGFISLDNGCRMALIGRYGMIRDSIADFTCIDAVKIRIGRSICTDTSIVLENNRICSTLIVGPPASGKTTMLRSIAKSLADGSLGRIYSVSVVDERNEIFPRGMCESTCVDVVSGIVKSEGINMAVRLFSPEVVICDEIGTLKEARIMKDSLNCGVRFICSMHAFDEDELRRRSAFLSLHKDMVFEKIILLNNSQSPCEVKKIINCKVKTFA